MTPIGKRNLAQLERLLARLEPGVRDEFAKAIERARSKADVNAAIAALTDGKIDAAFDALNQGKPGLIADIRAILADAFGTAGTIWMTTDVPISLRVAFSLGSPAALARMKEMDVTLVGPMSKAMEDGLRAVLEDGTARGANPKVIARFAKDFIGLTDYDKGLIYSFEAQLRDDPARALERTLRDARRDPKLVKAAAGTRVLTESEIQQGVADYEKNLLAWRSETWSRTLALRAAKEAKLTTWQEVATDGPIASERYYKTWITQLDGRERDEHHWADGTTVPIDEEFPVNGGQMTPGDNEYNCRCAFSIAIAPEDPARLADWLGERVSLLVRTLKNAGKMVLDSLMS